MISEIIEKGEYTKEIKLNVIDNIQEDISEERKLTKTIKIYKKRGRYNRCFNK